MTVLETRADEPSFARRLAAYRMHILVLPSWYPTSYAPLAGVFFAEQAEALARVGHRVGVIYPDQRSLRTLSSERLRFGHSDVVEGGVAVYRHASVYAPKLHTWNGRRWVKLALRLFRRYVDEQGVPDVIHAQSAIWAGVAASRIWRSDGIPFVLTEHSSGFGRGLVPERYRPLLTEAFSSARAVMTVSEAVRKQVTSLVAGEDVRVVPNGVDTEIFHLPPRPRPQDSFQFVCVASLDANKAVDILLSAFSAAFPSDAAVRLSVVGVGPDGPRIRRLAHKLGIDRRVDFYGLRDRLGVREILWSSHCCVLSSRVETFGVILIEALATGIPVVATRSGGPEDIVNPECGILTEVGSAVDLAAAMRSIYADRMLWAARSALLRSIAERRFSRPVVTEQLSTIYEAAVNGTSKWPTPQR